MFKKIWGHFRQNLLPCPFFPEIPFCVFNLIVKEFHPRINKSWKLKVSRVCSILESHYEMRKHFAECGFMKNWKNKLFYISWYINTKKRKFIVGFIFGSKFDIFIGQIEIIQKWFEVFLPFEKYHPHTAYLSNNLFHESTNMN